MYRNIIFDWSGTISDDIELAHKGSNKVMEKYGLPPVTLDEFRREMILPYMDYYHKYSNDITQDTALKIFLETVKDLKKPRCFKSMDTLLDSLYKLNKKIFIISSSPSETVHDEIREYKIKHLITEIRAHVSNKSKEIIDIHSKYKLKHNESVYVGDMVYDIQEGKKAGVVTIAVGWGYTAKEKLIVSHPDYFVESVEELEKILVG